MLACPSHFALELSPVTLESCGKQCFHPVSQAGGALPGEVSLQHAQVGPGITRQRSEARGQSQGEEVL